MNIPLQLVPFHLTTSSSFWLMVGWIRLRVCLLGRVPYSGFVACNL